MLTVSLLHIFAKNGFLLCNKLLLRIDRSKISSIVLIRYFNSKTDTFALHSLLKIYSAPMGSIKQEFILLYLLNIIYDSRCR